MRCFDRHPPLRSGDSAPIVLCCSLPSLGRRRRAARSVSRGSGTASPVSFVMASTSNLNFSGYELPVDQTLLGYNLLGSHDAKYTRFGFMKPHQSDDVTGWRFPGCQSTATTFISFTIMLFFFSEASIPETGIRSSLDSWWVPTRHPLMPFFGLGTLAGALLSTLHPRLGACRACHDSTPWL